MKKVEEVLEELDSLARINSSGVLGIQKAKAKAVILVYGKAVREACAINGCHDCSKGHKPTLVNGCWWHLKKPDPQFHHLQTEHCESCAIRNIDLK